AKKLQEELVKVDVAPSATIEDVSTDALSQTVDVRGNTENIGGIQGSIDRLTFEIMASLKERKTLVVWLLDESESMKERRSAVAARFENIYKQLGLLDVETKNGILKSAIVSFGKDFHFISKDATDDIPMLVKLVKENIPDDISGRENVFGAVEATVKKYRDYRSREHRNCMIVIVTDERGDDFDKLDQCIQTTASSGFKVYCVGNAAPFGQEKGYVHYRYPDGFAEDLPVDQGPETIAPEHVNLPFWGMPAGDLTRMTAGLGPYALTRLCAETQGVYLIADEMRGVHFDPAVMRNYLPDYRPIRFYMKDLQANRAKSVLVDAARKTIGEHIPTPEVIFRADTDNVLRVQLNEAQKPLAVLDYKLNEIVSLLEQGEKDRLKIKEPRWQAAFDTAYGRVLAMRVRAFGYNMMLAQMKATPKTFEKSGNNTWELTASDDITTGVQVKKMAAKAQEYLGRVVNSHQGTPWAKLAERELSKPMGWSWKEFHRDYEKMERAMAAAKKKGPLFADEEEKKMEEKKKKDAARVKPNL
ncbi:MAG TPA: vWA domain-containing protein, partial [Planctomycetaceae bacterium]|nr:vWA domain-containing protein [Planctomycetaceae bacterium]